MSERTIRWATNVPTMPEAWAFIMAHLDELGDAPSARISPVWGGPNCDERTFDVVVEGTTGVSDE